MLVGAPAFLFGIVVLIVGLIVTGQWRLGDPAAPAVRSIAVLPYDYTSADSDQAYLVDGLVETIRYRRK